MAWARPGVARARRHTQRAAPPKTPRAAAVGPNVRPYAALLLAFGATAACGSPSLPALARPPAESRVEHGSLVFIGDRVERVMESAADASGRTLVVVDSDRNLLVLRDGAVRASFARNELLARGRCARRPDPFLGYVSIGVSEDGREAWLVAIDGSKRPPIRTLSAACLVDLATGGTRPIDEALGPSAFFDAAHVELHGIPALALSQERAVVFGTTDTIDIGIRGTRSMTAFDIGLHDGACDVVVRGTDVVVACVVLRAGGVVRVLRLDTEGPTVRVLPNEPVPTGLHPPEISVPGGGRGADWRCGFSGLGRASRRIAGRDLSKG